MFLYRGHGSIADIAVFLLLKAWQDCFASLESAPESPSNKAVSNPQRKRFSGGYLATFQMLRRDAMTKVTYKRNHLTGGLFAVSEGDSMTVMMGSIVACRRGDGAVAESLHIGATTMKMGLEDMVRCTS